MAKAGLTIVNAHNRPKGSTVISCEDRDAVITKRLKKKGHAFAPLFNLHPEGLPLAPPNKPGAPISLGRSQLGWSLSLTPYSLRELTPGRTALDVFTDDLLAVCAELQARDRVRVRVRVGVRARARVRVSHPRCPAEACDGCHRRHHPDALVRY